MALPISDEQVQKLVEELNRKHDEFCAELFFDGTDTIKNYIEYAHTFNFETGEIKTEPQNYIDITDYSIKDAEPERKLLKP